jgi:ParB-like chromosome segregation protein Spo0J
LQSAGIARFTPIAVNVEGVIVDGHHAVRAAAELGRDVAVVVVAVDVAASGLTILELPIRAQ